MFVKFFFFIILLSTSLAYAGGDCDGTDDGFRFANQANFACTNATCTIAFWINSHSSAGYIYNRYQAYLGPGSVATDRINTLIRNIGVNMTSRTSNSGSIPQGTWTHVAVVMTTHTTVINNNNLTIYINGATNQGTQSHTGVDPDAYTPGTNILEFCWLLGSSQFKTMEIDDIRVYSGGLTAAQVNQLYASRSRYTPIPVPYISYIPFETCAHGANLHNIAQPDRSGSGNTLTGDDGANNTGMTCDQTSRLMMHVGVE